MADFFEDFEEEESVSEMLEQQALVEPLLLRIRDKWQYPVFVIAVILALGSWIALPPRAVTQGPAWLTEQIPRSYKNADWKYCRWCVSRLRDMYAKDQIPMPKEFELMETVAAYKEAEEAEDYAKDDALLLAANIARRTLESQAKTLTADESLFLRSTQAEIYEKLGKYEPAEMLLKSCVQNVFDTRDVAVPAKEPLLRSFSLEDSLSGDSDFRIGVHDKIRLLFRYGQMLKQNKKYAMAIEQFSAFLPYTNIDVEQTKTNNAMLVSENERLAAQMELGELWALLGKRDSNRQYLRRAADFYNRVAEAEYNKPRGFEARQRQAEILYALGDIDLAEDALNKSLAGSNTEARAFLFLGRIRVGRGQLKRAEELFYNCAMRAPEDPTYPAARLEIIKLLQNLAIKSQESGDFASADKYWEQSHKALLGLEDIDASRFQDNPYFPAEDFYSSFENLAEYQKKGKAFEKAVQIYRHVMKKYAVSEGEYQLKIAYTYDLMLREPATTFSPEKRRQILIEKGRSFMKVVELGYDREHTREHHLEAAESFYEAEDYVASMEAFKSFAESYGTTYSQRVGEAYFKSARSFYKLGALEDALEMLDRNIERMKFAQRKKHGLLFVYESQLLRAKIYTEQALLAQDEQWRKALYAQALADLVDVRERSPAEPTSALIRAELDMGYVYFSMENYEKAAEQFQRAQAYVPANVYQAVSARELTTQFEKEVRTKYVDTYRMLGNSLLLSPNPSFVDVRIAFTKYLDFLKAEYEYMPNNKEEMARRASETYEKIGDSYVMESAGAVPESTKALLVSARKYFEQAIAEYRNDEAMPYLNEKISWVFAELKNVPQAAVYYQRAIDSWGKLESDNPGNAKNYKLIKQEMRRISKLRQQVGPMKFAQLMRSQQKWIQRIRPID